MGQSGTLITWWCRFAIAECGVECGISSGRQGDTNHRPNWCRGGRTCDGDPSVSSRRYRAASIVHGITDNGAERFGRTI